MFGIGMPEMILILAVALIVFGPKKLPELAKSLGRALGEFKRATNDLKGTIQSETGLNDVRKSFKEIDQDLKESTEPKNEKEPAALGQTPPQDPIKEVKQASAPAQDEPQSTETDSVPADNGNTKSRNGTPI